MATGRRRIHTLEEARNFIEAVGFCLMYPDRSLPRVASFMGAFDGSAAGCRIAGMLSLIRVRNRPLTRWSGCCVNGPRMR